jgi:pimeloyl-ACP methyl ester carboxylesterase
MNRLLLICFAAAMCCCAGVAAQGPTQAAEAGIPAGVTQVVIAVPTTDGLSLPGYLTLPAATAPNGGLQMRFPVAVLGQGSGVQDADETVGANKVFQQLAWGLARRGVASLRYDRRALVAPANFMAHADLDHEVVIDAAAALAYAATLPQIDAHAIFFIGHSLAAEVGPDVVAVRLSQKPGSVRGLVLMSGVARPIDVVIAEQIDTLGKAQGGTPQEIAALQEQWADLWKQARDPATPATQKIGVGGALLPATYWRDWLKRDPVATLHTLHVPMLVTRGTMDFNSTHEDFELLKAAATAPGSDAREFPGLNHLYMPVVGNTSEFSPGKISPEFLDYLATWITTTAAVPSFTKH